MKRHRKDSGFAMLMVFLMAACVAITLYMEIPRVAFEAERQRELLLVDRGNQFKRAIQVFITDKQNNPTGRYPATIEELESFNNHRYLRRRYVDPMTGKDEWRLVHINGGVLTDSVTSQANMKGGSGSSTPNPPAYISEQSFIGEEASGGRGGGAQRAMIRRPSDSATPANPGDPTSQGGAAVIPGYPGGPPAGNQPNTTGIPNGVPPGIPGVPGSGQQTATPAQPCTAYIGGCPTTTTSTPQGGQQGQVGQPGQPAQFGQQVDPNGRANPPGFATPGQPGGPPQAGSVAANMINNLLTSPRPGGMPTAMIGGTIGGGIAGVASKYEAEGIMVIADRTAINEWEYIFDKNKFRAPPNPTGGAPGTPVGNMQNGLNGPGTPGTPPPTPGRKQ